MAVLGSSLHRIRASMHIIAQASLPDASSNGNTPMHSSAATVAIDTVRTKTGANTDTAVNGIAGA